MKQLVNWLEIKKGQLLYSDSAHALALSEFIDVVIEQIEAENEELLKSIADCYQEKPDRAKIPVALANLIGVLGASLDMDICLFCGQEITGKFCSCDTEAEMKHRLQQDENEQMLREWEQEQAEDEESRFNPYVEYGVPRGEL